MSGCVALINRIRKYLTSTSKWAAPEQLAIMKSIYCNMFISDLHCLFCKLLIVENCLNQLE